MGADALVRAKLLLACGLPWRLLDVVPETLKPASYAFAFFTSSISGGTMSNKFPTTA